MEIFSKLQIISSCELYPLWEKWSEMDRMEKFAICVLFLVFHFIAIVIYTAWYTHKKTDEK